MATLWVHAQSTNDCLRWAVLKPPAAKYGGLRPAMSYMILVSSNRVIFARWDNMLKPYESPEYYRVELIPEDGNETSARFPCAFGKETIGKTYHKMDFD